MSNKILHKKSNVSGNSPALNALSAGELAINTKDGYLFFKKNAETGEYVSRFVDFEGQTHVLNEPLSSFIPQFGGNSADEVFASVLGGYNNDVTGAASSIVNGENNDITSDFSFIGSGLNNKINGDYSFNAAGQNNLIQHSNVFTLGSNLSSHAPDFTYVNNLSSAGKLYGDGSELTGIVAGDTEATNLVRSNSASWDSTYTNVKTNSASWGTGGVAQNLSFDEDLNELSLTFGNTISLSSLAGGSGAYVPLSGGVMTGSLTAVDITSTGKFYGDGSELTGIVSGDTEATTLVRANSANWENTYTEFNTQSANNISVYTTVQSYSASWGSGPSGATDIIDLAFKTAYTTYYSELNYDSVTADLSSVQIYEDNTKTTHLFEKLLTYTSASLLTGISITDKVNSNTLTKTLSYDGNDNLISTTRIYN